LAGSGRKRRGGSLDGAKRDIVLKPSGPGGKTMIEAVHTPAQPPTERDAQLAQVTTHPNISPDALHARVDAHQDAHPPAMEAVAIQVDRQLARPNAQVVSPKHGLQYRLIRRSDRPFIDKTNLLGFVEPTRRRARRTRRGCAESCRQDLRTKQKSMACYSRLPTWLLPEALHRVTEASLRCGMTFPSRGIEEDTHVEIENRARV
jgi:hypothetical protein